PRSEPGSPPRLRRAVGEGGGNSLLLAARQPRHHSVERSVVGHVLRNGEQAVILRPWNGHGISHRKRFLLVLTDNRRRRPPQSQRTPHPTFRFAKAHLLPQGEKGRKA